MKALIAAVAVAILAIVPRSASSGPLVSWGSNPPAPPPGDYVALAAGGALQTLAIKADGTLYLSGGPFIPQPDFPGQRFISVGMGRNHALAIRPDGSIATWGKFLNETPATEGMPPTGQFVAVAGGSNHSVALDATGHIVVWGPAGTPAPTGIEFVAIAARSSYTLALSADGNIYGWGVDLGIFNSATDPWTKDGFGHFVAPSEAGNPYTAIAAGLGSTMGRGLIAALRSDGSVVVWDSSGLVSPPPANIVFAQIAAGLGYVVGIDQQGHLHAWGDSTHEAFTAKPDGVYSAVSAATQHASSIAGPFSLLTAAGPVNVWLGLKNSDDVGTKFDLLAEVLRNGRVIVASQLNSLAGGSSGFNNAILRTINLALPSAVNMSPGGVLSLRLSVRIAAGVSGHRSGTARLWFNDSAATSRMTAILNGSQDQYYLVGKTAPTLWLEKNAAGSGPKSSVDVFVDRAVGGNPFKSFGTWSVVVQ